MEKEELLFWLRRYNIEEDLPLKGLEEELGDKIRTNQYLLKDDLIAIVKWKFQSLPGRQKRTLNLLRPVDEEIIRDVSSLAFQAKEDETRIRLLSSIRGVGNALSSVILAFYNPQNYGVLDIHAWRQLFGKEPQDLFSNPKHAIAFFERLREISKEAGLPCREVEKAIFKKDLESGKMQ